MADLSNNNYRGCNLKWFSKRFNKFINNNRIVDVFERILTCTHSQTTTVAVFNSTPYGADGALDVENL